MPSYKISAVHTYVTKSLYQKLVKSPTKMYLRQKDKADIMEKCGDAALILYEFYLSKGGLDTYAFLDKDAARAMRWNIYKVAKNRRKLVEQNYFLQINTKFADKRKITVTYLDPKLIHEINEVKSDPELITKLLEEEQRQQQEGIT